MSEMNAFHYLTIVVCVGIAALAWHVFEEDEE